MKLWAFGNQIQYQLNTFHFFMMFIPGSHCVITFCIYFYSSATAFALSYLLSVLTKKVNRNLRHLCCMISKKQTNETKKRLPKRLHALKVFSVAASRLMKLLVTLTYFTHLLIRAGDHSQAACSHLLPSTILPLIYMHKCPFQGCLLSAASQPLSDGLSEFGGLPRGCSKSGETQWNLGAEEEEEESVLPPAETWGVFIVQRRPAKKTKQIRMPTSGPSLPLRAELQDVTEVVEPGPRGGNDDWTVLNFRCQG